VKTRIFILVLIFVVAAGTVTLVRQQQQADFLRAQLAATTSTEVTTNQVTRPRPEPVAEPNSTAAESDLLRLRGEVSLLRRELDAQPVRALSRQQIEDDWALIHSGPKPSEHPGFIYLTNCATVGFGTPEAALQSFYFAMRNQVQEPLDSTRMKLLWDVPDDFDAPDAKYSIDIGNGIGGELGYHVVKREFIGTNEARLTLEYERPDGSAFRRDITMVEHNGRWRLKPVRVSRLPGNK